jgi:hypothetical protein
MQKTIWNLYRHTAFGHSDTGTDTTSNGAQKRHKQCALCPPMAFRMMLWFLLFGAVVAAVQGPQLQSLSPLVHTVGKGRPIESMPSLYYKY